jgi:hypothetical protein
MKTITILIFSIYGSLALLSSKDCSNAYSAADDAYSYCKKAYNSDNLDNLRYYAKKAKNAFDDAMSYSDDCGCDDAYSQADDGYSDAKKAYNSDNLEDGQYYIKKAKRHADDTMSYADDCR